MDADAREQYLTSQVFTAAPERLHLMLVDGAIRFAIQLRDALVAGDFEAASAVGERCRNVLAEMLVCVQRQGSEAASRLRSIYAFLIREVAGAQFRGDGGRVDGVLAVLAVERDTWAQVCERSVDREFRRDEPHLPHLAPPPGASSLPTESFSFHA